MNFLPAAKYPHGQIDLFCGIRIDAPRDICLPFIPVLAGLQVPERIRFIHAEYFLVQADRTASLSIWNKI